jgi:hypothetical protein
VVSCFYLWFSFSDCFILRTYCHETSNYEEVLDAFRPQLFIWQMSALLLLHYMINFLFLLYKLYAAMPCMRWVCRLVDHSENVPELLVRYARIILQMHVFFSFAWYQFASLIYHRLICWHPNSSRCWVNFIHMEIQLYTML